jgi:ABC-type uncharacterized transport system auxiliary subunit
MLGCGTVLVVLAGCGGAIKYPKYYTLNIPAAPLDARVTQLSGTVSVRRFESAPYLRQKRIAYRPVPEEIGFYEYHRWAEDPAEAVTTAVIEALRSYHLFSSVKRYDGQGLQDYLLSGRVERLEETDYDGGAAVTTKLSAELTDLRTGATAWAGEATETLRVEESTVNAVVIQMNQAIEKSVNALVTGMDRQLARQPEERSEHTGRNHETDRP